MKKDIDTFIVEERAEILSKYDRVRPLLLKRHSQQRKIHYKRMNSKQMMKHIRNMSVCPVGVLGQARGCQR